MAELLGLILSVLFLVLVFLPVLTFLRLGRLSRDIEALAARVSRLEHERTGAVESAHATDAADLHAPPRTPEPQNLGTPELRNLEPAEPRNQGTADLEERIGGRGLLYTGVLVLFFGVAFFLKYAFDNAWINETARTVLGTLGGIGFVVVGLRVAKGGLDRFGYALAGTGFAILYLVVYAALNFYGLIDRSVAFLLMTAITVAAGVVADGQRSQLVAFLAVAGGLLTPAFVGGHENGPLTLFTYDALLVMGTVVLSLRHRWLGLNALTYAGTVLTVAVWASRYYVAADWLRTLLFLTLFCVCFLSILRATRGATAITARLVRGLLWSAPVLYHVAAIVIASNHPPAIHIYLIAFTVVGLWWTVEPYRPVLRLLILLAAFIPLFGALTLPAGRAWLMPNVVTITAIAVLHVMTLADRVYRQNERLHGADLLALHLAGIGLFALLYEALQPVFPAFRGGLAAVLAVGAAGLWRLFRTHDAVAALHALGLVFTLTALGIAVEFDGPVAVVGWAAEGAAAAWLGLKANRAAFLIGGVALWAFAALRLFDSFSTTPAGFTALFNMRALTTAFVVAAGYVITWRLAASTRPEAGRARRVVHVIASVVTLGWMTAEIQSFWEARFESPQAHLYEQMLLSLAWGVYGAVVIALGMRRQYAPLRYIGIAVIAVTALKVFFYDLWELGGIYRVVGFIGFGVLLVLVSYLYQRGRPERARDRATEPPAGERVEHAHRPEL